MPNPKALALAILATGAGAVIFLSSGQDPASSTPAYGPVPVVLPPAVTEVPSVHPAVPAAERVVPPPSTVPSPKAQATPKRQQAAGVPTTKAAPKRAASVAPRQQVAPAQEQPQPAGTEPNGSGGWQLPACYDPSCVAEPQAYGPQQGTGTESLNSTLGLLGIVNGIPALIGGL